MPSYKDFGYDNFLKKQSKGSVPYISEVDANTQIESLSSNKVRVRSGGASKNIKEYVDAEISSLVEKNGLK